MQQLSQGRDTWDLVIHTKYGVLRLERINPRTTSMSGVPLPCGDVSIF